MNDAIDVKAIGRAPKQQNAARRKNIWSRRFFIFAFLIFPLINFVVFYLYANIDSFFMAFQKEDYSQGSKQIVWTLDNFSNLWTLLTGSGHELLYAFLNTLYFNLIGTFVGLPIGILMAYFVYKKIHGYRFFRAVIYLPSIVASSALVVLFKYAIGDGGPLDAMITASGGEYFYLLSRSPAAILTILFYYVTFGYGGSIVIIGGAMNGINPDILEAAAVDGCNWFQELTQVILPCIWPTISTILLLSVANFFSATGPILAFTKGANQTFTLAYYIYALVSGAGLNQNLYLASALGICMSLLAFPAALLVKRLLYGKEGE